MINEFLAVFVSLAVVFAAPVEQWNILHLSILFGCLREKLSKINILAVLFCQQNIKLFQCSGTSVVVCVFLCCACFPWFTFFPHL